MGRTTAQITVKNYEDIVLAKNGYLPFEQVRSMEVEVLIDTGATYLCLTPQMIQNLGLSYIKDIKVKTGTGLAKRRFFGDALIVLLGRECKIDVVELEEGVSPLLGYVPLELLDLQVDPRKGTVLAGHGEEMIFDLY